MGQNSSIEWTDATWNPVVGCRPYSAGCAHCYAQTMSKRIAAMATADVAKGNNPGRKRHYLSVLDERGRFNSRVRLVPEALADPLGWKKPRKVFVNSMSDLFYGDDADRRACEAKGVPFTPVPFEYIDQVFAVMALTPWHTHQVLTKRIGRAAEYLDGIEHADGDLSGVDGGFRLGAAASNLLDGDWIWNEGKRHRTRIERFICDTHNEPWIDPDEDEDFNDSAGGGPDPVRWPLPNVILGTSVEDGPTAEIRLPVLRRIRQAGWTTFVSYEPALGPVDWQRAAVFGSPPPYADQTRAADVAFDWLISGGESGPGARPSHPDWHRATRDFCARTGTAYLFKQWGAWAPVGKIDDGQIVIDYAGRTYNGTAADFRRPGPEPQYPAQWMYRVGKHAAGRLLDGVQHDGFPTPAEVIP